MSDTLIDTDEVGLYSPLFPADWKPHSLYSLADWVNGMAFRNIEFTDAGLPVIKIAEIKNGISEQTKLTNESYDEYYRVNPGDMLFSWSGQPETSIDAFWWRGPEGWLNQHIFKVTTSSSTCSQEFLYYLLKYLKPNFIAVARNKQTTGLGHVTKADLRRFVVRVPSRHEQAAIVGMLKPLDDKIEHIRRTGRALEALARATFKAWFLNFEPVKAKAAGATSFPGMPAPAFAGLPDGLTNSPIGLVPHGWAVRTVAEAFDVNPPRRLSKGQDAPYLDMKNMPTDGHAPDHWERRPHGSGMRFINGDTLVARITPCLENGKTAYVDFLNDGEVGWGSTEYIVLRPKPPLPKVYAYCLARTPEFREFAIQNMSGTSGRQRVAASALEHYHIVVPDSMTAAAFGEAAQPLFECIRAGKAESSKLATLRDYLLPQLLSGAVRVKTKRAS